MIVILGGDKDVREMMLIAKNLNMTCSGDYAFLYTELIQNEAKGNQSWSRGKGMYLQLNLFRKKYKGNT